MQSGAWLQGERHGCEYLATVQPLQDELFAVLTLQLIASFLDSRIRLAMSWLASGEQWCMCMPLGVTNA